MTYDQGKPDSQVYHLLTSVAVGADYFDSTGHEQTGRLPPDQLRLRPGRGGSHPHRGWEIRKPTQIIKDPNGQHLTTTMQYREDSARARLRSRKSGLHNRRPR